MNHITDEQIFGQELDQEDSSAAVAENFCPFEQTICLCWDRGNCQSFLAGGRCVLKFAAECTAVTEVRKII